MRSSTTKIQNSEFDIEPKLMNDFSQPIQNTKTFKKEESLKDVKNVKEFKKFFSDFKRAMKFGSSHS